MNILYLITKSEAGGAQTHVYQLCQAFRDTHTLTVVANPGGWLEEECKKLHVSFIPNTYFSNNLNPLRVLKSFFTIKKIIHEVKPDIVHCHSSVAGFLGRLAVRKKIPTVYTAHGWGFNIGVGALQKWVAIVSEKIVANYTDKIICVSEFVKELGVQYRITSPDAFVVIYNGVELQPRIKNEHHDVRITCVGRLAPPKRPLVLLEAISLFTPEMQRDLYTRVVGKGPQMDQLVTYITSKKIQHIELMGSLSRERIFDILHNSDIFVFLSDWEGFPISILEAMSCGLPIVSSNVGGIREMVDDKNGILLAQTTPELVAASLERLVTDRKTRKYMGEMSSQIVKERFTVEHMVHQIQQVYDDLV
ncbi:MAG: hypothetical protein COX82_03655 [Candidatus Magasanikbacteria bacterium CG_4_10_14_0_2_um_filter_41_10]|uniref:Glycosyltransferase family 1 protein n=1 Tax=Candidatus Magasanikbacteria bacterium CG_4_10_14_0_2_um_filter_41_10 TaxID=1974638 RepID=A0A2M7V3G9_9BACT|nr:MAG: hypothetical protein COX82_03655 [Candidatus Magasanikbacteria bacterium CG_4_10_14_0_2_um_filter_41_10]